MKYSINIIIAGFVSFLLIFAAPTSMVLANSQSFEVGDLRSCEGLLVTQVQAGTSNRSLNEFVEVHNNTVSEIDLSQCSIGFYDQDLTLKIDVPLEGALASGGYLLVIHNSFVNFMVQNDITIPNPYIVYANQSGQGSINAVLATSGVIDVKHDSSGVLDTVYYGQFSGLSTAPKPDTGKAIKRCTQPDGFYRNFDDALDFYLSDAPTVENLYPGLDLLFEAGDLCEPIEDEEGDGGQVPDEPVDPEDPEEPVDEVPGDSEIDDEGDQDNTEPDEENQDTGSNDDPVDGVSNCSELIITEILPNPAGVDKGKEFIELHNLSDTALNLDGCGLQVAGSTKRHIFADILIDTKEYIAFYDGLTGLVLPNSAGGTVLWLDVDGLVLQSVNYPGGLKDDVSWGWFEGDVWSESAVLSPGSENIGFNESTCPEGYANSGALGECEKLPEVGNSNEPGLKPCLPHQERNPDTNRCRAIVIPKTLVPCKPGELRNPATNRCKAVANKAKELVACKPGQERNPETNRCRAVGSAQSLAPCKPGQVRNPDTNRCKSILALAATLKPCKPGQERNPETNRCRAVAGAKSLTPCKPGQERNPETNRCRKVAVESVGNLATVHDIEAIKEQPVRWWTAAIALSVVFGYALWEWRSDLRVKLAHIRKSPNKLSN
jgi:hypothetical protein